MVAFVRQILGILASQIEIERIFSIARALTTFKRCQLQTDNMDKLIFVHKNWPFDPRVGCLKPFDIHCGKSKRKKQKQKIKKIMKKELINKYINIHLSQCLKDIVVHFENLIGIPNIYGAIDGIHIPLEKLPNKRVKLVIGDIFNKNKIYGIVL
jgi:hypothetical protein